MTESLFLEDYCIIEPCLETERLIVGTEQSHRWQFHLDCIVICQAFFVDFSFLKWVLWGIWLPDWIFIMAWEERRRCTTWTYQKTVIPTRSLNKTECSHCFLIFLENEQDELLRNTFQGYNTLVRPVRNLSDPVRVNFGIVLILIISVVCLFTPELEQCS